MTSYRLLFADPDKNVHDGHKRMLRALRPAWTVCFASSAREAMKQIIIIRPNVLITELDLPLENGTDLVNGVQEVYPEIIRIVLSSETDSASESVLRATQSAHRFLAKPFKAELLVQHIEKAVNLRKLLKSSELLEIIGGIPYLPSLPHLYHELVRAVESPLVSMNEIGEIIAKDVSMTGRILHLVNSAFFGLPRKVLNPQTAVVLLGINVIKSLLFYVKIFFAAPDRIHEGLSLDELWRHSSLAARLSKEIAADLNGTDQVLEESFLAGMLHDVGKLLLVEHPKYYNNVMSLLMKDDGKEFANAEYEAYGVSHAEIGAYLLGLWGLPDTVVEAVACHHCPTQLNIENSIVLLALYLANYCLCAADDQPIMLDDAVIRFPEVKKLLGEWKKKAVSYTKESRE